MDDSVALNARLNKERERDDVFTANEWIVINTAIVLEEIKIGPLCSL